MKTQAVRLIDVFVLGPVMIYAGLAGRVHPVTKLFLAGAGVATVLYNAHHYARQRAYPTSEVQR